MLKVDPLTGTVVQAGSAGGGGDTHTPVIVANAAARLALTGLTDGAVAFQSDNSLTYVVIDNTQLDSEDGWELVDAGLDATMPGGILPSQAEADNYPKFTTGAALDISSSGISYVSNLLLTDNLKIQWALRNSIDMSLGGTNTLTTESIADILTSLAGAATIAGVTTGTLSLAGATMGTATTPTPASFSITPAGNDTGAGTLTLTVNGTLHDITFGTNGGHDVQIGTDDEGGIVGFDASAVAANLMSFLGTLTDLTVTGIAPEIILTTVGGGFDAALSVAITSGILTGQFPSLPGDAVAGHAINADLATIAALGVTGDYALPDHTTATF